MKVLQDETGRQHKMRRSLFIYSVCETKAIIYQRVKSNPEENPYVMKQDFIALLYQISSVVSCVALKKKL